MQELKIGLEHSITHRVTPEESALKVGSGLVDVYATPALIALCEKCCSELAATCLPEGDVTVGSEIHVNHNAPSKIGAEVKCSCQLIEVQGRKLHFRFYVHDNGQLVALGQHFRVIVNKDKFMSKLN